jgi:hypothetical protein
MNTLVRFSLGVSASGKEKAMLDLLAEVLTNGTNDRRLIESLLPVGKGDLLIGPVSMPLVRLFAFCNKLPETLSELAQCAAEARVRGDDSSFREFQRRNEELDRIKSRFIQLMVLEAGDRCEVETPRNVHFSLRKGPYLVLATAGDDDCRIVNQDLLELIGAPSNGMLH